MSMPAVLGNVWVFLRSMALTVCYASVDIDPPIAWYKDYIV